MKLDGGGPSLRSGQPPLSYVPLFTTARLLAENAAKRLDRLPAGLGSPLEIAWGADPAAKPDPASLVTA
jgi:hypothetical protein